MSSTCQSRSIVRGESRGTGTSEIMPAFPIDDLVKSFATFLARRGRVPHLAVLEINPRLLSPRAGKLERRSRAADALELNDVGDVQIAQRSLKTFAFAARRGGEQCLRPAP